MNEKQKEWVAEIPQIYQQNYKTAISGKSKTAGIKAKCLDCTNWQRVEISDCPVETCPLWPYRPYKINSGAETARFSGTLKKNSAGMV